MEIFKKNIENEINKVLKSDDIGVDEKNSISEALEKLLIYHEELRFQNDELKSNYQKIEKLKDDYEKLFMNAPVAYIILNHNFEIIKFNNVSKELFENEDLLNNKLTNFISPDYQDDIYKMRRNLTNSQNETINLDLLVVDKIKHVKIIINKVEEYNEISYKITLIDETEKFEQVIKIKYLSYHDQLTGLYNRYFLKEELKRLDCERNLPLGIIMADVNGLKLVNDAFGHNIGDDLIVQASKVLLNNIRCDDIISRIGGDEFIILLPNTSVFELKQIITRMINSTKGIGVKDLELSIAFGYSIKKSPDENIDEIIQIAENRMYKSKLLNHTSQRRGIIDSIIATLHEKHPREQSHSEKVSDYAVKLAKKIGYDHERLINIKTAGMLHDIGKVAIDYSILDKKTSLTKSDFIEVRKHPEVGYRILSSSGVFGDIAEIVLCHHEHVDGTGYPRNLVGDDISEDAKILCICDAYDAMTSDRSYRVALPKSVALEELKKNKGTQFDPKLVDVFCSII